MKQNTSHYFLLWAVNMNINVEEVNRFLHLLISEMFVKKTMTQ